jgi:hypothetical protein
VVAVAYSHRNSPDSIALEQYSSFAEQYVGLPFES